MQIEMIIKIYLNQRKKQKEKKNIYIYIYIYIFVAHWTHGLDNFFLIAIIIIKLSIRTTPLQIRGKIGRAHV